MFLLATCHVSSTRAGLRDEVKARAGSGVTLRCAVNKARCGDFHSIKWYKENRRVYVYSPVVDFSKVSPVKIECYIPTIPNLVQEEFINFKSSKRSVFMIESSGVGKLASIKIANFLQFNKMMTRRKFSVFVLRDSRKHFLNSF